MIVAAAIVVVVVVVVVIMIVAPGIGLHVSRARPPSIFLILKRIDGRFVVADGRELIAHDGEDEETVENGYDGEKDRV